jgi:hypothetical protein
MKIKLVSNIGCCGLTIEALLVDAAKAGLAAMKQAVFHDSASTAYPSKDDAPFNRKSPYSPELAAHVEPIVRKKLEAIGFGEITIATKAVVRLSDEEKFTKDMTDAGITDKDAIAAMWLIHPKNPVNVKPEIKAEIKAVLKPADAPVSLS